MGKFNSEHYANNSILTAKAWWATDQNPGRIEKVITATMLEELFTRWAYVKGTSVATFEHGGEIRKIATDGDAPIIAVSRDTGEAVYMGTNGDKFTVHDPNIWLGDTVAPLIDAAAANGIRVRSAIHLGSGEYTAVTLSAPVADVVAGMAVERTFSLLTSQSGALSTGISKSQIIVVCDNTAAASDRETIVKVKHTSGSLDRLPAFRTELDRFISEDPAEALQWVGMLADMTIDAGQYAAILDQWAPKPNGAIDTKGAKNVETRRKTIHEELWQMYMDPKEARVAQWSGTALGAYQALSTWDHFSSHIRGQERVQKLTVARLKPDATSTHPRVMGTLVRALSLSDETAKVLCPV